MKVPEDNMCAFTGAFKPKPRPGSGGGGRGRTGNGTLHEWSEVVKDFTPKCGG